MAHKYLSRTLVVMTGILIIAALSSCSWRAGGKDLDSNDATVKPIEILWSVDVDGRKPADPLAYGHVALTAQGDDARVVIGGRDGRAHVYNLSGDEIHRVPLLEASDSGTVILASGLAVLSDTNAQLYAIDPQLGKVVWKFSLSSPVTGLPIRIEQDVLVQCTDNRIYRINANGKKVWSFSAQAGGLGLYLNATPLLHENRIYALLSSGDAVALDAATGDLIWRKQLLLNTDAAHLADLKAPQAAPIWMDQLTWDGSTAKDLVFFAFYQGDVFALSRADGSVLLTHTISLKSAHLVDAKHLYMADSHGNFQAVDRSTGIILWQEHLSDAELVGPIMWQESLWLADSQGSIFRMDQEGHVQASINLPGAIDRPPVATSRGVLLHTSLGGLYLVR
ncbi:MAG: PQQ-binding-like beta-propeller repeat protein [Mariprofundaceae bacterium]|nr:PQQ-binding-like beta-propeller repeat protein [Mariprofundaceae bacterium]